MAYTESSMLPLGTRAPEFILPDPATGSLLSLHDVTGQNATVVMFLCNHCPYVIYVNPTIVQIVEEYAQKGVSFVGINSNDAEDYPEDGPDKMPAHAREAGYTFPYLYDETQSVARAFDAACTPDFYVFDGDLNLYYRGQLDESRPKRNPVPSTGSDLRAALESLLASRPAPEVQRPSGGCNIKWNQDLRI
ncbi:MAG: thioredoxin family protein [Saprospiraceae bacterium]|nr:thioredoxin family protein [Saprospiraceae bacterium]